MNTQQNILNVLNTHHTEFFKAHAFAQLTSQPTPCDTRAWSQILVSVISNISGVARQKGADLADGSDVKAANTWGAIDTPRFNGVIKAGTKSSTSGQLESLDNMPNLYFVLWDNEPIQNKERCRVWVVRPQFDVFFREMCSTWYEQLSSGIIKSTNFQLHPPRNLNSNLFKNNCGHLNYPLLLEATMEQNGYVINILNLNQINSGFCEKIK